MTASTLSTRRPSRRRRTTLAVVLLACLTASACGSTVADQFGVSTQELGPEDPQRSAGTSETTTPDGLAATPDDTGGSATPGGTTGGGTSSGTTGGTTQATTGAGGPLAPATIKVGIQYSSNAAAALSSIGSGGGSTDPKAAGSALIGWINANGGLGGRRAIAAWQNVDAYATPSQISTSACTQWSQDDKVDIATPSAAVMDNNLLRTCMNKAGIPTLYQNVFSSATDAAYASTPMWFESVATSVNSYARNYVEGLASQGFFKDATVGVVYNEQPQFKSAMNSDLLPALKAAGIANPVTFAANITGLSDLAAGAQQMSSAILSFRSKGVNRVLFFEPWAGYFEFLQIANSQGYKPLYGISSQGAPQVALEAGLVPAAQLEGAKLVSWWPLADVKNNKSYLGGRVGLCTKIFQSAGITVPTDALGFGGLMSTCENLLLIQDAYRNTPGTVNASIVVRNLEALTKAEFATKSLGGFAPGRHSGASVYWTGQFDKACGCFALSGEPKAMR